MARCDELVRVERTCGDAPVGGACDKCTASNPEAHTIQSCAVCKEGYIKVSGCNIVLCPNCGFHTCAICGQEVDGHDSVHSKGNYYGTVCTGERSLGLPVKTKEEVSKAVRAQKKGRMRM